MKTKAKVGRTKGRRINKALDKRFTLHNKRGPVSGQDRRAKSLMDMPDVPRRRAAKRGPRRTQLGETLPQGELAARDPVREG
jgi:hypothetical protein